MILVVFIQTNTRDASNVCEDSTARISNTDCSTALEATSRRHLSTVGPVLSCSSACVICGGQSGAVTGFTYQL
jgi:hypothetical protein